MNTLLFNTQIDVLKVLQEVVTNVIDFPEFFFFFLNKDLLQTVRVFQNQRAVLPSMHKINLQFTQI